MTTATAFPASDAPAPPSDERLDALARELDAIGDAVRADLGQRDADYIHRVIAAQRGLEAAGRALLLLSRYRPAQLAGIAVLLTGKIIENMEMGHNILHGQWDWMRDPEIHSTTWEWDFAPTAKSWQYSHNVQHHTYTNVLGLDRDLGYSAMRTEAEQPWHPVYLLQPIYGLLMGAVFEWGIALYDMELDAVRAGRKTKEQAREEMTALAKKGARQIFKDYVAFPALAGRRGWRRALAANATTNVLRNLWVETIVFCGHIPEEAETFTEEQMATESRGGWYRRQLLGSCNLEGSPAFHLMTGNLSYQIEHHLFPDIPSNRYREIAPAVREVCERHGMPYNTGPLGRQLRSVVTQVLRLSLP